MSNPFDRYQFYATEEIMETLIVEILDEFVKIFDKMVNRQSHLGIGKLLCIK